MLRVAVHVISAVIVCSAPQREQEQRQISPGGYVSVESDGLVNPKHKKLFRKSHGKDKTTAFVEVNAEGQSKKLVRAKHPAAETTESVEVNTELLLMRRVQRPLQDEPEMQHATGSSDESVTKLHLHAHDRPANFAETQMDKALTSKERPQWANLRRRRTDPRRRTSTDPRRRTSTGSTGSTGTETGSGGGEPGPSPSSESGPSPASTGSTTLEDKGNPPGETLQKCQGDCDSDGDCAQGLKCHQRSGLESIPGCSGSGTWDFDYCTDSSGGDGEGPSTPPCTGSSCKVLTVMSYNTEYKNYNSRMGGYGRQIKQVGPAIAGVQECQNKGGLAKAAGYRYVSDTHVILYDDRKVRLLTKGKMRIKRDNYASRNIHWGQFDFGGQKVWFFNTHLPHNHNEAKSQKTHAEIARQFLAKRRELGAGSLPTVMVGDMNSHASNHNRVSGGGFCSNLQSNGFTKAYTARGGGCRRRSGYGRIDHILYSTAHFTHKNCRDSGCGGSDHTSITCDLVLKSSGSGGGEPGPSPSSEPGPSPTSTGSTTLEDKGNPPGEPLQKCQGDCDSDGDCAQGLKCHQRSGLESVPGCSGSGTWDFDYCIPSSGSGGGEPGPAPTPNTGGGGGATFHVVSYNLFWWNAFDKHSWKGKHIMNNIKNNLRPDLLGGQEVGDAGKIERNCGLKAASEFRGGQGTFVKPGRVSVIGKGRQDIRATGKWGTRYVTWAKLRADGKEFFHFNTHWCVSQCDENKRYGGAKNMMRKINELTNNLNTPAIITGDFNAFGGSRRRRIGGEKGPNHFRQNGFEIAAESYVDGIFYSKAHWTVGSTSVGDAAHSDHKPIIADLTLK